MTEEKAAVTSENTTAKPVKKVVASEKTVKEQKNSNETVVYVGSSIPKAGLQQFSIFKNGLPASLDPHIEKCPAIKALMVPVSQLTEARRNLATQGTGEYVLNQKIQSYARSEK